jgi:hypothetical protein
MSNKSPIKSPAIVDTEVKRVPPLKCRWLADGAAAGCGRGMQPATSRWATRKSDSAPFAFCRCPLCGSRFVYYPAFNGQIAQIRPAAGIVA